jgi:hypothetical protein
MAALTSLSTELEYHFSDQAEFARRLSERALLHLQRSIVASPNVRAEWQRAFAEGEVACEQLGSAALLQHGIWAFKAHATGERTDLIFGEPLTDLAAVERSAEALVLTEWKVVPKPSQRDERVQQARAQAGRYGRGILGGLELAGYRYLVLVSRDLLEMPADEIQDGVVYRHVNIAVDPQPPSSPLKRGTPRAGASL